MMNMQAPDPKDASANLARANLNGAKTTPPPTRQPSQPSVDAEIIARSDAEILSLKQTVQFQQNLLIKQQDLMERQISLVAPQHLPGNLASVAHPNPLQASVPLKVTNHPIWSNYISGCLLFLTSLLGWWVAGYFRHSPDIIVAAFITLGAALSFSAFGCVVFFALAKKKMPPSADRLSSFAMGTACLCFLAAIGHAFWTVVALAHHGPKPFWLFLATEVAVVLAANLAGSTLHHALRPALDYLDRKLSKAKK